MNYKSIFNSIVAIGGTAITALMGGWSEVLTILAILILIDYITGLFKAWDQKKLSSELGYKGIIKKAGIFIVVILSHQMDRVIPNQTPLFRTISCLFYIANEGISITENITELGVPMPGIIVDALEKLKEENDNGQTTK